MVKKLKILFIPVPAVGHVNACVGVSQVLKEAGHQNIFYVSEQWRNKLTKYGIEEVIYKLEDESVQGSKINPGEFWTEQIKKLGLLDRKPPLEKLLNYAKSISISIEKNYQMDKIIDPILKDIKPDLIIIDQVIGLASVEKSGIPWVLLASTNPLLYQDDEHTPPPGLGKEKSIDEWFMKFP